MKRVKLLAVLITMALFTINLVDAQPKNYSITTDPYIGIAYCGTEVVVGTQTTEFRWNKNKLQIKVHWSLVGQETGAQYEAGFIRKEIIIDNSPNGASMRNLVFHFKGKRDNVPMGHGSIRAHLTINANGVPTAQFFDMEFICHK
jgi:hypothetical protein